MYISYIGTKYLSLQLNYKRIEKSNEQTHIEFIQNLTKKFSKVLVQFSSEKRNFVILSIKTFPFLFFVHSI